MMELSSSPGDDGNEGFITSSVLLRLLLFRIPLDLATLSGPKPALVFSRIEKKTSPTQRTVTSLKNIATIQRLGLGLDEFVMNDAVVGTHQGGRAVPRWREKRERAGTWSDLVTWLC